MKAFLPSKRLLVPSSANALQGQQNAIQRLLKPILDLSENSDYLIGGSVGEFEFAHEVFKIPRFIFLGPGGGGDSIRIGIFAVIHGDEPEGAEALVEFLEKLEEKPRVAQGYHLYIYPICNPTGFAAGTRKNAREEDLMKHFWSGSSEPEIYYLEREIGVLRFHGLISLQTNEHDEAFHIHTSSTVLSRALIHPAMLIPPRLLSVNLSKTELNKDASAVNSSAPQRDFLTAGSDLEPRPFELHIGMPHTPDPSRIQETVNVLGSILDSYRSFQSIGQNI